MFACAGPWGHGSGTPSLKNYKNAGFLSNTGPDILKITKLPNQHSILRHQRPASELVTPFAGGPMMARFNWYPSSTIKTLSKFDPSDKTIWIRAWLKMRL